MAAYEAIYDVREDPILFKKVQVACWVKAKDLIDKATPTAEEMAWASSTLDNPRAQAEKIMLYVLAKNNALELAQITGAGDTAVQTQVSAAVDALITGGITI